MPETVFCAFTLSDEWGDEFVGCYRSEDDAYTDLIDAICNNDAIGGKVVPVCSRDVDAPS